MRSPITHPWFELGGGIVFIAIGLILGPLKNDRDSLLGQLPDGVLMWVLIAGGVFFVVRGIIGLVARGRAES